jgi:dUTP pyrophosphatase
LSAERAIEVRVRRLDGAEDLPLPRRATEHAAGFDLPARLDDVLELVPGERSLVPTGFAVALPEGYEAQVRPRSGLAIKRGLTLLNSPGTIDADYRGEICVVLVNLGRDPVRIQRGDRIAQLIVQRLPQVVLTESESLPESSRGAGGFGHTGER